MIDRREILEAASSFSLLPSIVEKDYVLGWMLAGINAHGELGESWVFKGVGASAGVVIDIEFELVGGNIETRLFRHPGADFFEGRPQEFLIEVFFIAQGKIQIF